VPGSTRTFCNGPIGSSRQTKIPPAFTVGLPCRPSATTLTPWNTRDSVTASSSSIAKSD
jgi:hypothetical protein